jgi:hypothetical protein
MRSYAEELLDWNKKLAEFTERMTRMGAIEAYCRADEIRREGDQLMAEHMALRNRHQGQ